MATAQQALARAAQEVGYSRWSDPEAGTRYGRWYAQKLKSPSFGANGVPFCAMFVSYILDQVGQPCPGLPAAYCPYILNDARKAGIALADRTKAQPGDLVIFNWDGGVVDHIGFVELNKGSYIQTIEGNTNNGAVARRTRAWSVVAAIVRVPYGQGGAAPAPAPAPSAPSGGLDVDGLWGSATTRRAQQVCGTPVDGEVWHQYNRSKLPGCTTGWKWDNTGKGSPLIRALQAKWGAPVDGVMGPKTANAMIRYYMGSSGATVQDGKLDAPSLTIRAFQRALNAGRI